MEDSNLKGRINRMPFFPLRQRITACQWNRMADDDVRCFACGQLRAPDHAYYVEDKAEVEMTKRQVR